MNDLVSFLTSPEIMIGYIILGISIAFFIFLKIYQKKSHKNLMKQNTKELKNLVEEVNDNLEEDYANNLLNESLNIPKIEEIVEVKNTVPVIEQAPTTIDELIDFSDKVPLKPTITIAKEEEKPQIIFEAPSEVVENKEKIKPLIDQVDNISEIEVLSLDDTSKEELVYEDIYPTVEKSKEELENLTKKLIEEDNNQNIELTDFEAMQEENAIISLEEYLARGDELYSDNEVNGYSDEGDEPISLADLELRMNKAKEEVKEDAIVKEQLENKPTYQEQMSFQSSPIISPVYGIEETKKDSSIELENTANYEKLDEEIRKTNEFLSTLKELQEKLQ